MNVVARYALPTIRSGGTHSSCENVVAMHPVPTKRSRGANPSCENVVAMRHPNVACDLFSRYQCVLREHVRPGPDANDWFVC